MSSSQPVQIRVAAVLLHQEGRVLMQHRDDRPDIVWPAHWAMFGGHLEPGETPEEAAVREIEEELELRLAPPLSLFHHEVIGERERFVFVARLEVPLDALTQREGQGMALLAAGELDDYPLIPAHRAILERFFAEYLGSAER